MLTVTDPVKSYYFQSFDELLSFDDAKASCAAKGGYLAYAIDSAELLALQNSTLNTLSLTAPTSPGSMYVSLFAMLFLIYDQSLYFHITKKCLPSIPG